MLLESILKFYLKPKESHKDLTGEPVLNNASNEAACICIELGKYMTMDDRRNIAEYFKALNEVEYSEFISKACR